MYENLLPIGSVVLLEGGNKRLMICGRIQARTGDKTVYDYSGCYFPEGIVSSSSMFFFNHENIENVYFIGFQDEEEIAFRRDTLATLPELMVNDEGQIVPATGAEE